MKTNKYFCAACGKHFTSNEEYVEGQFIRNLTGIRCPKCGEIDIYPDTPESAERELRNFNEYESSLIESNTQE